MPMIDHPILAAFCSEYARCRAMAGRAEIVLLAKHAAGARWQTLSIEKRGSMAYNRNPTREKAP